MIRVIIYGIGARFKKWFFCNNLYRWMENNDIYIVGVADGNLDKVGRHVNISDSTYEIKYIGEFTDDSYDYILITSEYYFEDIRKFLISQGISEDIVITVKSFVDKTINTISECNYGISIAAIVKDEVEYIEEWIQFHILMGIEHFYIYDNESSDGTIKSIYNPRAVVNIGVHHAEFVPGYCCISENGSEISGPFFRDGRCQRLRINHYVSKSEEEFINRMKKGKANRIEWFPSEAMSFT